MLSFAALFALGAGVSLLTGRSLVFRGLRQVAIGAVAAVITYAVGTVRASTPVCVPRPASDAPRTASSIDAHKN